MNLEDLQQLKSEIKRFSDKIDEGIQAAKLVKGRTIFGSTEIYGKHDISGTRVAGSIKRQAQELKYYLTKKVMKAKKYEQCTEDVFNEIKNKCISVWKTFDNSNKYVDEKLKKVESIKNHEADVMFMLNMFHPVLKKELVSTLSQDAKQYIKRYED